MMSSLFLVLFVGLERSIFMPYVCSLVVLLTCNGYWSQQGEFILAQWGQAENLATGAASWHACYLKPDIETGCFSSRDEWVPW